MGSQDKSPNNTTQRVKVYRLNEDGKWDDQGTGHVTVDYLERSEDLGLFVIDEDDNETLLLHRISSDDIYRKQEDTIISWRDPVFSTELALSFQETTGCSYIWDHICSLQWNMRFNSLADSGGKQLGEELVVEVIEFSDANKLDSSELEPASVYPVIYKSVQYNQKEYHHSVEEQQNDYHHSEEEERPEECTVAASNSNARKRKKRENSFNPSYELLKSHFHMKEEDVAKKFGVSRSTFKRVIRKCGIERWPFTNKSKKNPYLFEEERAANSEQGVSPSTVNLPALENVTQINTGSADKVIVKVKYNEDLIKFELSLSLLGLAKLSEEVATSLNLEKGSFKLKYKDEDGDEILLTRDIDLQHCPKTTIRGETLIQLLVR